MVAKILKPTSTFSGVGYSEKKIEAGKCQLMVAENFYIAGTPTHEDYINRLNMLCDANSSVKNKQFHATISCHGKEYTAEQLTKIGKEWMQLMGYGKQPYLIYYHSDTANNHIHLVSARVQANGERINPQFEGIRAVNNINLIMENDLSYKAKNDSSKMLQFSFTTLPQAKLILEQMGWKVIEKEGNISLIKNGKFQHTISAEILNEKIQSYAPDIERKKQLIALIYKYSKGMSLNEMQKIMKTNFGIDMIFHTGKGHDKPYGYTLIDNKNKTVYKGGDIVPIKTLIFSEKKDEKIKACAEIVDLLTKDTNKNFEVFKKEMESAGYKTYYDGKIRLKSEYGILYLLNSDIRKKMQYNSRVEEANKFRYSNPNDKYMLSKLFYVKANDINIKAADINTKSKYSGFLSSVIGNNIDLKEACEASGYELIRDRERSYLVDKKENVIFDASNFDLKNGRVIDSQLLQNHDFRKEIEKKNYTQSSGGFLGVVFDFFGKFGGGVGEHDKKRRRKTSDSNN